MYLIPPLSNCRDLEETFNCFGNHRPDSIAAFLVASNFLIFVTLFTNSKHLLVRLKIWRAPRLELAYEKGFASQASGSRLMGL